MTVPGTSAPRTPRPPLPRGPFPPAREAAPHPAGRYPTNRYARRAAPACPGRGGAGAAPLGAWRPPRRGCSADSAPRGGRRGFIPRPARQAVAPAPPCGPARAQLRAPSAGAPRFPPPCRPRARDPGDGLASASGGENGEAAERGGRAPTGRTQVSGRWARGGVGKRLEEEALGRV